MSTAWRELDEETDGLFSNQRDEFFRDTSKMFILNHMSKGILFLMRLSFDPEIEKHTEMKGEHAGKLQFKWFPSHLILNALRSKKYSGLCEEGFVMPSFFETSLKIGRKHITQRLRSEGAQSLDAERTAHQPLSPQSIKEPVV